MKAWQHLLNSAMLGTDKPMPGNAEMPDDIAALAHVIDGLETLDKEDKYLQKAALVYNYRQCGFTPLRKPDLIQNPAEAETQPYCTDNAAIILIDILEEGNDSLLQLWLTRCAESGQLLQPDMLPALLNKAQKNAALKKLVTTCSGNRGLWLSRLNADWNFFTVIPDEEIWQNGTPTQRVELLKKIRKIDPQKARECLQQTWAQENAANKLDLLKTLFVNRGPDDLPFLESLLLEKGQKIKDEALNILKQIPGSSIVKQYEELLRQSVVLKKEKTLLGMMTKISIQQKLPAVVDDSIFKSGIERLTGVAQKNMTDESFIIYQLAGWVPPSFWLTQFDATPAQVVEYFEKYANDMVGALGLAVTRFSEHDWMRYFLHMDNRLFGDFVDELTPAERDQYLLRLFKNDSASSVIHLALRCKQEWGHTLALTLIMVMANDIYKYNRQTYSQAIGLIPVSVLTQLQQIDAKEPNMQPGWLKQRHHLTALINLKQQTLNAFNA